MKKLTFILIAACAVISGGNLFAQGKYGADSAECIKYLNYYQEYYKQKNYDAALPNWRKAYSICPASASQNMFIHGTTLLTRVFSKTGPRMPLSMRFPSWRSRTSVSPSIRRTRRRS